MAGVSRARRAKVSSRSRRMGLASLVLAVALLVGACASSPAVADGCTDYHPLDFCSPGFRFVCDTADDGCERCGCLPERTETEPPGPRTEP